MYICKINNAEYELQSEFEVNSQTGNTTSTTITVLVENQDIPKAGDILKIIDNITDTVEFLGVCGIPSSPTYTSINDPKEYEIECTNANAILARRLVYYAAERITITAIVQYLFDNYIVAEGITLGNISDIDISYEVYTANGYDLQTVLNEIATTANAIWEVTNDLVFNFIVFEEFPSFPHEINAESLIGAQLQHKTTNIDVRTVQSVDGATQNTTVQAESFEYTGEETTFTTSFAITQEPSIKVNGIDVPSNKIGVQGLNSGDNNIAFLFAYESKSLQYNSSSNYLTESDIVAVSYIGQFPIRVVKENTAKISEIALKTGTSGRIENAISDTSIKTNTDAEAEANSLLDNYGENRGEITFTESEDNLIAHDLTLSNLELYTKMIFNLPEIGITGTYVITESKITYGAIYKKISVKARDRNYLRSYADTINDLGKDIHNLTVRADDVVIQNITGDETINYSEAVQLSVALPYFPVLATDTNIFAPTLETEVYPT